MFRMFSLELREVSLKAGALEKRGGGGITKFHNQL